MVHDSAPDRVRSHLEKLIAKGRPGDRLPSVRQLMADLGVSPATIRQAVSELTRRGEIEAISGSGTFIATRPVRPTTLAPPPATSWQSLVLGPDLATNTALDPLRFLVPPGVIDLASGYPDASLQPTSLIAAAVREAVRRPGTFGRVASEGSAPLREWFEEQIDPEHRHRALIMPGGQAALSLIFRALCLPGDNVLMESPTYAGALVAARSAGVVPVPVPVDSDGLCVDKLERLIQTTGARMVYLQPRFQNPTGTSLGQDRIDMLLRIADRHDLVLVEDDWLADLALPGRTAGPLASLDTNGHVVHVRSLTKSIAPGIRVAAIAAVGAFADRLHRARSAEDFFVSPLLQETALGVVTSPRWPGHVRRLRTTLLERRAHLKALVEETPGVAVVDAKGPTSPLHLWVEVFGLDRDVDLREAALRCGVSLVAGREWHPGSANGNFIRLSNAAVGFEELSAGMDGVRAALLAGHG